MAVNLRTALITGANGGIGKEVARQLAASERYGRIHLACRDRGKGEAVRADLTATTGRDIFEVVLLDVADLTSVGAALASIQEPIDDLVMNAGGSGGRQPLALTADGVTNIFAANMLGHVALLDGLLAAGLLRRAAVYVGSEAARGVPKLGMKRPELKSGSAEEFASFCDGSYFNGRKPNANLAYGQVKLVAAFWMAAVARRHSDLRFITMSPGNTSGTGVARDLPLPARLLVTYLLQPIVMPLFGIVHPVEKGAARLVEALNDPGLQSGTFYASKADALTGPVIDQSAIFPELGFPMFQENANAAVHRFLDVTRSS